MSEFTFAVEVPVRYGDLDPMDHVNNAVYASYLEQARIDYFDRVLDDDREERELVLASLSIDFRRPVTLDDEVEVAVRVTDLGESSFGMAYEVRASDEVAATAETTQVAFDAAAGESRPLPASWRENIADFEGLTAC